MKDSTVKWLGIGAMVVGAGASLLSAIIGEKKQDATIEKKVSEAIAKIETKGE